MNLKSQLFLIHMTEGSIKEVFNERDTMNIIDMSIVGNMGEDNQCWKFTNHREHTVKSTYHYTMENLVD